jgi:hypothetical protein
LTTPFRARKPLRPLRDEAKFLMGLSRDERIQPHWLDAIEALILVLNFNGPTMFVRIGTMRALNHGKPNLDLMPRRKRVKAYK